MQDMRTFISQFEKENPRQVIRVTKEIDPKFEVTALVRKLADNGSNPILIFENVKGSKYRLACNVCEGREKFAVSLGCPVNEVEDTYSKREAEVLRDATRFKPVEVTKEESPCKEVVLTGDKVNMFDFPVVTHHEGEAPYLTRGIGIVKFPNQDAYHAAHYRLMVKKERLGATHLTPGRHLWDIYNYRNERNEPLEIAFVIGCHPSWSLGSQARIHHPPYEYDVMSALLAGPVELVSCETIDVKVPARAEVVFEGVIPPGELEPEGPWGDFTRYSVVADRHPVQITAITCRKDAIFQDMGAWTMAGAYLPRIPLTAHMIRKLREAVPDVISFRYGPNPELFYGLISLKKHHPGQPKQAILAAMAADLYLKYVVCFDEDINLDSSFRTTWALATRVQADKDVFIIPGVLGTDLDVSSPEEALTTKVGVDATAKPFLKDFPKPARIPKNVLNAVRIGDYVPGYE